MHIILKQKKNPTAWLVSYAKVKAREVNAWRAERNLSFVQRLYTFNDTRRVIVRSYRNATYIDVRGIAGGTGVLYASELLHLTEDGYTGRPEERGDGRLPVIFDASVTTGTPTYRPVTKMTLNPDPESVPNINAANATALGVNFSFTQIEDADPLTRRALGDRFIDNGIVEAYNNIDTADGNGAVSGRKWCIINTPANWVALGFYPLINIQLMPFFVDVANNVITLTSLPSGSFNLSQDAFGVDLDLPINGVYNGTATGDQVLLMPFTMPIAPWYRYVDRGNGLEANPNFTRSESNVLSNTVLTVDWNGFFNKVAGTVPSAPGAFSETTQTDTFITGGTLRLESTISGTVVDSVASSVLISTRILTKMGDQPAFQTGVDLTDQTFTESDLRVLVTGGAFTPEMLAFDDDVSNGRWREFDTGVTIVANFLGAEVSGLGGYRFPNAASEYTRTPAPADPFFITTTENGGGSGRLSAFSYLRFNAFQYATFRSAMQTTHTGFATTDVDPPEEDKRIFHSYSHFEEEFPTYVKITYDNGVPTVTSLLDQLEPERTAMTVKDDVLGTLIYDFPSSSTMAGNATFPIRREAVPYDLGLHTFFPKTYSGAQGATPFNHKQGMNTLLFAEATANGTTEIDVDSDDGHVVIDSITGLHYMHRNDQETTLVYQDGIQIADLSDLDKPLIIGEERPLSDNLNERLLIEQENFWSIDTEVIQAFIFKRKTDESQRFERQMHISAWGLTDASFENVGGQTRQLVDDIPPAAGRRNDSGIMHSVYWPDAGGPGIHGVLSMVFPAEYNAVIDAYHAAVAAGGSGASERAAALAEVRVIYNNFASDDFILAFKPGYFTFNTLFSFLGLHFIVLQ